MATKYTRQHIEQELYYYNDTLKQIDEIRLDAIYTKPSDDDNTGGGRSSLPGKPTESRAIALHMLTKLQHMEQVAHAITSVLSGLDDDKRKLVKLKYHTKPQVLTWDGIAIKLNISKRQAIRWRDEIVELVAERMGWRV